MSSRKTSRTSELPITNKSPVYVVFSPQVTFFLILTRIYWFLASFVPVVAAVMITYSIWTIKDDIHVISESL